MERVRCINLYTQAYTYKKSHLTYCHDVHNKATHKLPLGLRGLGIGFLVNIHYTSIQIHV